MNSSILVHHTEDAITAPSNTF